MTDTALEPHAIDVLASTPATLRALLGGLPEATVEAPADEGWSPKDVVAHLLSVEGPNFTTRVAAILEADRPLLPNLDEGEALERSGLRARPLADLLADFERERAANVALARGLSASDLARAGRHEVAGEVSIADLLHHKAYHDLLHVEQMSRMLAVPLDERRGNMRAF